jgi:hypothetical protein
MHVLLSHSVIFCTFHVIGLLNLLNKFLTIVVKRGTNGLKEYLRSRIEPPEDAQTPSTSVFQESVGTSGIIGGIGDGIDRHKMASTKALEYRCDT